MSLPAPPPALLKTLALITILSGLLYAGHAWLSPTTQTNASASPGTPDLPMGTMPAASMTASPKPARLNATEIAQAYARSPQSADARFKGQRLRLQGVVDQTEAGQGQVLLITLGTTDNQAAGLRAVVDMGAQTSQAPRPAVGQTVGLDCLNQGLLMGEPVMSDCRLLP